MNITELTDEELIGLYPSLLNELKKRNIVSIDRPVGEITSGERITGMVPINAPKAGIVWSVSALERQVLAGDALCTIISREEGEDNYAVEAERTGIVRQVFKRNGDPVEVGETLFLIEADLTDATEKLYEKFYEEVWRELEQGNKDMGLWARLLSKHDGNEGKTTADYLKTRVERLSSKN